MTAARQSRWDLFFWILSTLLIFTAIPFHEPWRDEAQALLLVADSESWWDMVLRVRWEGHPLLWFALIKVVGPALIPYVHGVIAASTNALILFKSPWPKWFRWSLPFTYWFLFEFAVVYRNYALGVLLLFLAVHFWKSKPNWSFAFLLIATQSNIFAAISAIGLGLLFWSETRKDRSWKWRSLLTISIGLLSVWAIIPPESNGFLANAPSDWLRTLNVLSQSLYAPNHFAAYQWPLWVQLSLTFAFFLTAQRRFSKARRIAFLATSLSIIVLATVLVAGFPRHFIHIWIVLLLLSYLQPNVFKSKSFIALQSILVIGHLLLSALFIGVNFTPIPFSNAENVANYLEEQKISSERVAVYPDNYGTAISLASGKAYYLPLSDTVMTHIIWSPRSQENLWPKALEARLKEHFREGFYYVVTPYYLPNMAEGAFHNITFITEWEDVIGTDEKYYLFQLSAESDSSESH